MGDNTAFVVKRGGQSEAINLEKVHRMVEAACRDVAGVSESSVEMNSGLQFYDGITSTEIQSILIKSAADLICLETPNYQYVAARLLLFQVRKSVFNTKWKDSEIYPPLKDIVLRNINYNVYVDIEFHQKFHKHFILNKILIKTIKEVSF